MQRNPKSGKSREAYERYKVATNLDDYQKCGGNWGHFNHDIARGFCRILTIKRQKRGNSPIEPNFDSHYFPSVTSAYKTVVHAINAVSNLIITNEPSDPYVASLQSGLCSLHSLPPTACIHNSQPTIHGIDSPNFCNHILEGKIREVECTTGCIIPRSYYVGQPVSAPHMDLYYIDLLEPWSHGDKDSDSYDSFLSLVVNAKNSESEEKSAYDDIYFLYIAGDETMMTSMQDTLTGVKTPWTIREAINENNPHRLKWRDACRSEMQQLKDTHTYDLIKKSDLPRGTPIVTSKIAWKLKLDENNQPVKYKARCVARGFSQVYGKNFTETFQPVARLEAVRAFIATAVSMGLVIRQMDFEGAYLQGNADHEIYMSFDPMLNDPFLDCGIPEGYVARLRKSIYGLKQAGHVWWQTLTTELHKHGFKPTDAEPCILICKEGEKFAAVIYHVDDGLLISNDNSWADRKFQSINKTLKHTVNDKPANWYLGMKIDQHIVDGELVGCKLSQPAYIEQLCKKNGIADSSRAIKTACSPTKLSKKQCPRPEQINKDLRKKQELFRANVGALLFLARCTMPSISFAVGRLGRFASNSGPEHWTEMNHLLKYCNNIRNQGIFYSRYDMTDVNRSSHGISSHVYNHNRDKPFFTVFTDSDFAGCPDSSRSTSGNVLTWMGAAISWSSSLQACVTLLLLTGSCAADDRGIFCRLQCDR